MKIARITLFIVFSLSTINLAQEKRTFHFGKTFQIGGSYTWMGKFNDYDNSGNHYFNENTINLNAAMKLTKRLWLGLQAKPVVVQIHSGGLNSWSFYNFNGIFSQVDPINKNGLRVYFETSLNLSDYCLCDGENIWDDPYRERGLLYWGGGGGLEFNVNRNKKKNLFLELAFFNYIILQDIPQKYNYTQYILGLNYRFGKLD